MENSLLIQNEITNNQFGEAIFMLRQLPKEQQRQFLQDKISELYKAMKEDGNDSMLSSMALITGEGTCAVCGVGLLLCMGVTICNDYGGCGGCCTEGPGDCCGDCCYDCCFDSCVGGC